MKFQMKEKPATLVHLDDCPEIPEEARIAVQHVRSIVGLSSDFKFIRGMAHYHTLSVKTEAKVDDLIDCLLPREIFDRIRGGRAPTSKVDIFHYDKANKLTFR